MGHVSPYAWTLLCIYLGQVGIPGRRLRLPICEFKEASSAERQPKLEGCPPVAVLTPWLRRKNSSARQADCRTRFELFGPGGLLRLSPRGLRD